MRKQIVSENYDGEPMTLVDDATFTPINEGDVRTMRDGAQHTVTGGRAPHKPGSTGRVYTSAVGETWHGEYFPAVVGATWMHDATLAAHGAAVHINDLAASKRVVSIKKGGRK